MIRGSSSQPEAHLRSEPSNAGMVGGMLRWDGNGTPGVAGETGASGMKGFGAGFSSAQGATWHCLQAYSPPRLCRV